MVHKLGENMVGGASLVWLVLILIARTLYTLNSCVFSRLNGKVW